MYQIYLSVSSTIIPSEFCLSISESSKYDCDIKKLSIIIIIFDLLQLVFRLCSLTLFFPRLVTDLYEGGIDVFIDCLLTTNDLVIPLLTIVDPNYLELNYSL